MSGRRGGRQQDVQPMVRPEVPFDSKQNYRASLAGPMHMDILPSAVPLAPVDARFTLTRTGQRVPNPYAARPARRQVKKGAGPMREFTQHGSEYNIWYHKKLGDKYDVVRMKAQTRVCIASDAGYTKADKMNKDTYLCIYFARGHCTEGPECQYYHRIPLEEDEIRLDMLHDVFGRDRHRSYRDDMGGVGSFNKNNTTLYISGLKREGTTEELVMKHFSEFGKVEYVRVIWSKCIAFVRYSMRSSAEFAKEAMIDQSLVDDEVLILKWANEDPNPSAGNREEMRNLVQVAEIVQQQQTSEDTMYQYAQTALAEGAPREYPQTDGQYYGYYDPNAYYQQGQTSYANYNEETQEPAESNYATSSRIISGWFRNVSEDSGRQLERYTDTFISGGFGDLSTLSQIDDIGMDALGVEDKEDRRAIMEALPKLKEQVKQAAQAAEEEAALEEIKRQKRETEEMKKYQEYQEQQYTNEQYAYYQGNDQYAVTEQQQPKATGLVDYGSDDE
ncbi:pre-mRNA-splicing factor cwc2 [Planoprotostelium fungivorum]|uniref:Pre-mRNA-splicing factor cwc2 n=1 Tax=Planoprotostelium fungivorum TaxID=1890364 RepID=A0A2P6N2D6_9EUKA|nr:pre-mRNA-splicing factor cwc2 [Planoprotostelium fungivorum]